jgi:hypothetical protein
MRDRDVEVLALEATAPVADLRATRDEVGSRLLEGRPE